MTSLVSFEAGDVLLTHVEMSYYEARAGRFAGRTEGTIPVDSVLIVLLVKYDSWVLVLCRHGVKWIYIQDGRIS